MFALRALFLRFSHINESNISFYQRQPWEYAPFLGRFDTKEATFHKQNSVEAQQLIKLVITIS